MSAVLTAEDFRIIDVAYDHVKASYEQHKFTFDEHKYLHDRYPKIMARISQIEDEVTPGKSTQEIKDLCHAYQKNWGILISALLQRREKIDDPEFVGV